MSGKENKHTQQSNVNRDNKNIIRKLQDEL